MPINNRMLIIDLDTAEDVFLIKRLKHVRIYSFQMLYTIHKIYYVLKANKELTENDKSAYTTSVLYQLFL